MIVTKSFLSLPLLPIRFSLLDSPLLNKLSLVICKDLALRESFSQNFEDSLKTMVDD